MNILILSTILVTNFNKVQEENCMCKPLPRFSLAANDGFTYNQDGLSKKPTVVFFLSAGCPHNPKSAPDINRLKSIVGSKVGVVAMTNLSQAEAKSYAKELKLQVPLLADPKGETIAKFGAKHSLDIALICSDDKKVSKFWEGYNRNTIKEMLTEIENHGGPKIKSDLKEFSEKRASGCSF